MAVLPEFDAIAGALAARLGPCRLREPLPSGTTGPSFLVEAGGEAFVVKRFDARGPALLDPERQFGLLETLAAAGVAPEPYCFDAEARLLVVRYLSGAINLTVAELRRPDIMAQVCVLLRRLHGIEHDLPPFAPAAFAAAYAAQIGGSGRLLSKDRERLDELLGLAAQALPGAVGICHNDLAAENILLRARPVLIDFDYAVGAPPIVDLASLAVMNAFSEADSARLLASYFGRRPPIGREEFARVQRLLRLLNHFWAMAAAEARTASLRQYRIDND